LFIAPRDWGEPASQPGWNKVHFSLFGVPHSGRYHCGLLKHRFCCPQQGRGRLCDALATAALQFKCEVGTVGGDDNGRDMTGKQEEVKERETTAEKKTQQKDKE